MEFKLFKGWVLVLVCLFQAFYEIQASCLLDLNKDFGMPTPVMISHDNLLAPNAQNGRVYLELYEPLLIACPGTRRYLVLGEETTTMRSVEAYCVSNNIFRIGKDWVGPLSDVKCNSQPWADAVPIGECYPGHTGYKVGYEVKGTFYPVYESCFDPNIKHTLYSIHELTPASKYIQMGGRPSFVVGEIFDKVRMNMLYGVSNQRKRLDELLGPNQAKKYVTKKVFLNRGHYAPRADFPFMTTQRATFHYVNAAPQWNRGNGGDWAGLEESLRRRVYETNSSVIVFTGTYGVMTLPDVRGKHVEIYLGVDENNNAIVPVPMYFYKLVYDPISLTASAFVTVNSPFYDKFMNQALTFCNDICEDDRKYSWLKWRSNDNTHSFCCDYEDFIQIVKQLPQLKVTGRY